MILVIPQISKVVRNLLILGRPMKSRALKGKIASLASSRLKKFPTVRRIYSASKRLSKLPPGKGIVLLSRKFKRLPLGKRMRVISLLCLLAFIVLIVACKSQIPLSRALYTRRNLPKPRDMPSHPRNDRSRFYPPVPKIRKDQKVFFRRVCRICKYRENEENPLLFKTFGYVNCVTKVGFDEAWKEYHIWRTTYGFKPIPLMEAGDSIFRPEWDGKSLMERSKCMLPTYPMVIILTIFYAV